MRSDAVPLPEAAEILMGRLVRAKVLWNMWCSIPVVDELTCNEQTVYSCVVSDVPGIWLASVKAMVRINLNPLAVESMINVVAVKLL